MHLRPSESSSHFDRNTAGGRSLLTVGLLQDFRHSVRGFSKSPVFAAMAILTLALGIGANTAMFSVMNAVLLRYLPVAEPQQVVHFRTSGLPNYANQTGNITSSFSGHTFERLREEKPAALSDLMAYVPLSNSGEVAIRHGLQPETASVMMVSGNFLTGLGVRTVRGRTLLPDDEADRSAVAVLSHAFWTRRFARNPSVLGETLLVKGIPFAIIGVAAAGFDGIVQGARTDLWIPLQTRPALGPWGQAVSGDAFVYDSPTWWFLMMVGRLAPDTSREQALAQLDPLFYGTVYGEQTQQPDEEPPRLSFEAVRGAKDLAAVAHHPLALLMAMVVLVLVIACSNIVMLLVARNSMRRREFGLRLSLGASHRHLFRQLLTESLLLVAAGGLLGWFLASGATRLLAVWSGMETGLTPDATVLVFTFLVCVVVALVFGLIPLRAAAAVPPSQVLRASSATSNQERGGLRSGRVIVALQMALCLALLAGAGLLVRSLFNLQGVDLGFRTANLMVFGVNPERGSDEETLQFYRMLLDEVRVLPGVQSATLMGNRIGSGWSNNSRLFLDGTRATDSNGNSILRWNLVGPDYFETLGVPILQGRDLRDSDSGSSELVVVVNRTFIETYLPDREPLGHSISLSSSSPGFSIVGVAQDSKYTGVRETPRPMAYVPYTQVPGVRMLHMEVRARREADSLFSEIRGVLGRLDPELPLIDPITQQAQFEQTYSDARLFARLALFFGLLAALLVAVGLYGTLSYRVSRRTVEIGVRMALGAKRRQILWMMLRESLLVCAAGALIGIPLALGAGRLLQSNLFGLEPNDPMTFLVAVAGVVFVTLSASLFPARRAASVDPLTAIRYE